jgi:hypothetical protein
MFRSHFGSRRTRLDPNSATCCLGSRAGCLGVYRHWFKSVAFSQQSCIYPLLHLLRSTVKRLSLANFERQAMTYNGYGHTGKGGGFWQPYGGLYAGYGNFGGAKGGKGKGKGKPQAGYYYDRFPERAGGLKVLKCKNPKCFGSILLGNNPPPDCTMCGRKFDIPNKNVGRAASPAPSVDRDELKAQLKQLVELGLPHEVAVQSIKKISGVKDFNVPRAVQPSVQRGPDLSKSADALNAANKEASKLANNLVQQHAKYDRLYAELSASSQTIDDIVEQQVRNQALIVKLTSEAESTIGSGKVAMHMCGGLGDDSLELMQEITAITAQLPKDIATTLDAAVSNLVSCAQAAITEAGAGRQNTEDKLEALQARLLAIEKANGLNVMHTISDRWRTDTQKPPTPPPTKPPEVFLASAAVDLTLANNAVAVAIPVDGEATGSSIARKTGATTASEQWQEPRQRGKKARGLRSPSEIRAHSASILTNNPMAPLAADDDEDDNGLDLAKGLDDDI